MEVFIEQLSEKIIDKLDLSNEEDLDIFLEQLKDNILQYLDPDFIYESEESEDFTELPEKNIKYKIDSEGFWHLVD
jgi:hypothetical protein